MTAEQKVLLAANDRFLEYMRDRRYTTEEQVLQNVTGYTPAGALIRAVAEWRIAKRGTSPEAP